VRDGDGDRAAAAMRAHIESTRDSFRHALITSDPARITIRPTANGTPHR
jgi:DNA-binding GntR family transcriptional regulator